MKKSRAIAASAGTLVGFGALVSYNMLHAALADPSAPLPPDTDLSVPVTVEASTSSWAFARSPALTIVQTTSPQVVTPQSRVTINVSVANISADTSFTNVQVSNDFCDPRLIADASTADGQLGVGETWKYSCSAVLSSDKLATSRVTAKAVVAPSPSPSPIATPSVTSTPSPTPTVTPSKVIVDGTYTGSLATVTVPGEGITYQVQVQAVISGGRITAITMPVHTETDSTSKTIVKYSVATTAALNNDPANPTMIFEAITGNTAQIATISGATYTTAGFKASLQTALTAAGY